jgi:hypothetical protein
MDAEVQFQSMVYGIVFQKAISNSLDLDLETDLRVILVMERS